MFLYSQLLILIKIYYVKSVCFSEKDRQTIIIHINVILHFCMKKNGSLDWR